MRTAALAFTMLALTAAPANAATIVGLFNTGVDASGNKLAANDAVDTHYVLNGAGSPVTYTHPSYLSASDAVFIAAQSGGGYSVNPNVYTLTFDLSGLNAATAQLSGKFAADNYGDVRLNGVLLAAQPSITDPVNFQTLTSFAANSGFLAGANVLTFTITDTGAPSAFLVTGLSGTADAVGAVPEPATWAMMIGGFGLIGGAMRRRSAKVAVTYA